MANYSSINAIIFRMFNAQESDKIIHVLTDGGNRITLAAKGVRKSTSRKAHAIDLLNQVKLKLGPEREIPMITDAVLVNSFPQFKSNYTGLMFCQLICEVLDIFVQPGEEDKAYFRNLENLLLIPQPGRLGLLAAAFILRYLYLSGHLPQLDIDVVSGDKLSPDMTLASPSPGYTISEAGNIPSKFIRIQKFILQNQFSDITKLGISPAEETSLLQLHIAWVEFALQVKLKSSELFISSL